MNLFILLEEQDECQLVDYLAPMAFEHNSEYGDLYAQYGLCLVKMEMFDEAERNMKKSIELNPENAMFWGNLGKFKLLG